MAFGYSPFEVEFGGASGAVAHVVECTHLRVMARVPFPSHHRYSPAFIDLIRYVARTLLAVPQRSLLQ
jgi:hypothetical protein